WRRVHGLEFEPFVGPVYNLHVQGDNSYVAEGIGVHNCVAHAWAAKVRAAPIMQQMTLPPYDFYRQIVAVDEFPDNDHEATGPDFDLQSGTTVRAGAKTLVTLGYAKSYLWAESAEDVRAWILAGFGGVVIGTRWDDNMMTPDADGFISPGGSSRGGHCTYLNGWSDRAKRGRKQVPASRGQNSWGDDWGQKGRFWLSMEDLDVLIKDGGEAAALTESRVVR
ncbi:MAG TPA: hypothetical protein VNJ04_16995, partial [Gemmatimonadaceae bacterium]|nr:hypothetical protein [Gemmatimonadaceae bacterium]